MSIRTLIEAGIRHQSLQAMRQYMHGPARRKGTEFQDVKAAYQLYLQRKWSVGFRAAGEQGYARFDRDTSL